MSISLEEARAVIAEDEAKTRHPIGSTCVGWDGSLIFNSSITLSREVWRPLSKEEIEILRQIPELSKKMKTESV